MPKELSWTAIGHSKQKEYLAQAQVSNQLAQVYLFVGPEHIGKTTLARDLARKLTCGNADGKALPCNSCFNCKSFPTGVDTQLIDKREEISIDDIRQLKKNSIYTMSKSQRKVFVIANAHRMTREAANALLKILEEPHGLTTFILTASYIGTLPATVISRSQKINFCSNTTDDLIAMGERVGLNSSEAKVLIKLSCSRTGYLYKLAEDEDFLEKIEEIAPFELTGESADVVGLINKLSLFEKLETAEFHEGLEYLAAFLANKGTQDTKLKNSIRKQQAVLDALESVSFNANKKLVLDQLLIAFSL